jgi:hypothetical protein
MSPATRPRNPLTRNPDGTVSWTAQEGDTYLVTGTDRDGRRFRATCSTWRHASSINIWRGSRWLIRDGRKFRINTTCN